MAVCQLQGCLLLDNDNVGLALLCFCDPVDVCGFYLFFMLKDLIFIIRLIHETTIVLCRSYSCHFRERVLNINFYIPHKLLWLHMQMYCFSSEKRILSFLKFTEYPKVSNSFMVTWMYPSWLRNFDFRRQFFLPYFLDLMWQISSALWMT